MSQTTLHRLTGQDRAWHAPYCQFVRAVFPRAGFERWIAHGDWDDRYLAFALVSGSRILANAALTRMQLQLDGVAHTAWQLGAVGVLPEARGLGLGRIALEAALQHCGREPVLLFANPSVRDFYPRFGFVAMPQVWYRVPFLAKPDLAAERPTAGVTTEAEQLQLRRQVEQLAAHGLTQSDRCGARGHGAVIRWYLDNGMIQPPQQLGPDQLIFAEQQDNELLIRDILCREPFDLRQSISRLITEPITQLRFGFTPDRWWSEIAQPAFMTEDPDADLFVRGISLRADDCFPLLART